MALASKLGPPRLKTVLEVQGEEGGDQEVSGNITAVCLELTQCQKSGSVPGQPFAGGPSSPPPRRGCLLCIPPCPRNECDPVHITALGPVVL